MHSDSVVRRSDNRLLVYLFLSEAICQCYFSQKLFIVVYSFVNASLKMNEY